MAAFHGKQGVVTFTGLSTFEVVSFTVEATADVADATILDDSAIAADKHWKTNFAGFKSWTATCECVDTATSGFTGLLTVFGTSAALSLNTTAGIAYGGTALLTGFSQTTGIDDVARATLTFTGDSNMTAA